MFTSTRRSRHKDFRQSTIDTVTSWTETLRGTRAPQERHERLATCSVVQHFSVWTAPPVDSLVTQNEHHANVVEDSKRATIERKSSVVSDAAEKSTIIDWPSANPSRGQLRAQDLRWSWGFTSGHPVSLPWRWWHRDLPMREVARRCIH